MRCHGVESYSLLYAAVNLRLDYAHPSTVTALPVLSEDERKQVLSKNAKEVVGL